MRFFRSLFVIALIIAIASVSFGIYNDRLIPAENNVRLEEAKTAASEFFDAVANNHISDAAGMLYGGADVDTIIAESKDSAELVDLFAAAFSCEIDNAQLDEEGVSMEVSVSYLDINELLEGLPELFEEKLTQKVEAAKLSSEIYDSEMNYLPQVKAEAFEEALAELIKDIGSCMKQTSGIIEAVYVNGSWKLIMNDLLRLVLAGGIEIG